MYTFSRTDVCKHITIRSERRPRRRWTTYTIKLKYCIGVCSLLLRVYKTDHARLLYDVDTVRCSLININIETRRVHNTTRDEWNITARVCQSFESTREILLFCIIQVQSFYEKAAFRSALLYVVRT